MKKTNRVQRAIAAPTAWRKGAYVADYDADTTPGRLRNAVLFAEAMRARLMRKSK